MEIFALDGELAHWEAELPLQDGAPRLIMLLKLAWHLRQRDSARAQRLAQEAAPLLVLLPAAARSGIAARFQLIDAEAKWLFGQLDGAQALAGQALEQFAACADAAGRADAHWLLAWIAVDRGDSAGTDAHLAAAASDAHAAGDVVRTDVFDAAAGIFAVYRDLPLAHAHWGRRFAADPGAMPADPGAMPAVAAGWISDFFGTLASQSGDFGRCVRHSMLAFERASASGQLRRAINLATNIGNAFTSLNTHEAALEWMQRGLDLARPTGWPMSLGLCQVQTAETLRLLGRRDAAQQLLDEAIATLAPLSGSRTFAVALAYQGDLALERGEHDAALATFALLERRGEALRQADFQSGALRGQALALSHLNRPDAALQMASTALAMGRENRDSYSQIAALKVLAEIHARHPLRAPATMLAPNAALHYLQLALDVAATIDGYAVPGDLLDALARACAVEGDYARAYAVALQAGAARDRIHSREAGNRATALQVQFQTERAQAEGEHHRQLAVAEAQRAEMLQQTSATLEHLSEIGQEITAHLDAAAVFRTLDRHVHGLLDATHFSVFLLEADGQHMHCAFGIEAGKSLPVTRFSLADEHRNSVRCVLERREILVDIAADESTPNLIPGTLPTLSLLFAPLLIGARVLGVMTVQSLHALAYGERERLIFRTLCAYGAIALDNAGAYRQVAATLKALSATQAQLLDKNLELERAYLALEEVSLTDQLTGLRNRRFFLQNVDADVAMSLRGHEAPQRGLEADTAPGKDLVFFMVDLDHFKDVNDRYGHAAGDAVLVQMQQRLRVVFRESDYLIRWGGEEFLVLARATQRDEAMAVAERIRAVVADRAFELPCGVRLLRTCSIGFACFPFLPAQPRLLSWSQVVELADQGLYIAKKAGRNSWAALYSTARTRPDGIFQRLMGQQAQCVQDGEVRLVASAHPAAAPGDALRPAD